MITISVNVFGGIVPIPIRVFIDNLDNDEDIIFTARSSFHKNFDMAPGRYMIAVSGMNPAHGRTEIDIFGSFATGPAPASPQTVTDTFYSVVFKGTL